MIFLRYWAKLNRIASQKKEKLLVIASDVIFFLTAAIIGALSIIAVLQKGNADTFGLYIVILIAMSAVAITIDINIGRAVIDKLSSPDRINETIELLNAESFYPENGYIFNRSVKDNIMYGDLQATEEDFNRAFDTVLLSKKLLGEEKSYISDSDKEKIILARKLLTNPESIDLNKFLSGCDGITIKEIANNIKINYPETKIL
jgi:ABC-type transport system involved in cytochrome bd biosynthesis fused ATPase/permease subunit